MAILSLTNPVVGGSEDTWGTTLNTNFTNIGTFIGALDSTELAVLDGITATTAELNILDGVTATTAELNYVDGVTSNIQTQLDAKQPLDAELTAIAGLTSAANKVPYFTGAATAGVLDFLDEDTMSSNSATAVPSQQSVKAYVDTEIAANATDVGAETAALAVDAVGTYAFMACGSYTEGQTVAGSSLSFGGTGKDTGTNRYVSISGGATPSGTWRCMGYTVRSSTNEKASLFLRIS